MKTIRDEVIEYALEKNRRIPDVVEFWSERAAIREYDGNTARRIAETNALDIDVKKKWP